MLERKALLWLGIGAVMLAILALKGSIEAVLKLPTWLWTYLLIFGALFAILGIVLGCVFEFISDKEPIQNIFGLIQIRDAHWFTEYAEPKDLPKLHKRYKSIFGKDVPSTELMRSWLNRYKTAFVLVYRQERPGDLGVKLKFAGSYKLLPLTELGVAELRARRISGSTFPPQYIASENERPAAFYVGDLFADGGIARTAVLFHLDHRCRQLVEKGFTLYARPFTKQGARVMVNSGFVHVSDGSTKLEIGELCLLEPSNGPIRRRKISIGSVQEEQFYNCRT